MSSNTERAPVATPAERPALRTDLDTQGKHGRPQDAMTVRRLSIEWIGLAAAALATVVMYVLFFVHPVEHEPLNAFLAMYDRFNAAVWPMQLVWYASAAAMVGLALWPRRLSTQLICLLAAAYLTWVGIAFFGVLDSGMGMLDSVVNLAWLWAATFILEALLFLVAGIVRRDLVIAPRWDLSSVLGAVFMFYAIVAYPIIGLLSGQPLHTLPVFGLSPCATVIFFFGLLLWAQPPAPKYLLLLPLAWALEATPSNIAMGHAADFGMALVGVITVGLIIWRDRTSSWQTVAGGVLLAAMIAFSGHDDLMIGTALVLTAVTLVQTIRGDAQRPRVGRPPRPQRVLFVDNLRIVLICGVVVVHLAVTYRAIGDWYYYDPAYDPLTAILLSFPNFIGMATAMGVFFLIAGYFTPGSSDRKWAGPFLRDRLVRLGIPLLIYDSLIQPFVMYIAAGFPGSYGKFYTTYLLTLPAIGHGPAWFIEALLFFVMLYALWRWLNSKWSQAHPRMTTPTGSINPARTHPYPTTGAMLLYIVGLALITFVIRIWFPFGRWFPPLDQNVGEFPQYISMFILGLIAYRRGWLTHIPDAMGKRWLWMALIDLVLFVPLVIWGGGPPSIGYFFGGLHWQALVYALWEASLVVAVSIGLLVLFRRHWNRRRYEIK